MPCRSLRLLILASIAFLALACSETQTRTFTLDVKNVSSRPITIGLTKLGPPTEAAWYSPDDLAISLPRDTLVAWGTVVPAGKTAFIDGFKGEFAPGTSAVLRVYAGDLPLSDMLALNKDSKSRKDLRLEEGKSTYVVSDRGPFIDAFRTVYQPGGKAGEPDKDSVSTSR